MHNIIILICLKYKLFKREWFMIILISTVIARIFLIFISAPAPYFMYYLSAYLCSYIISSIVIWKIIQNLIDRKKKTKIVDKTSTIFLCII